MTHRKTPQEVDVRIRSSLLTSTYYWLRQRQLRVRLWDSLARQPDLLGASLAVVGNAGYLADLDQGDYIDRFDLVLRMNNFRLAGLERQVGSRLDIFMSTFHTDVKLDNPLLKRAPYLVASVPNNFSKHGLRWRHGQAITRALERLGRKEVFIPPNSMFQAKLREIGKYPTTGAMALYLVLENLLDVCGDIYVTGFSFFEGRSHYFSNQAIEPANHDPLREREILAALLRPRWLTGRIRFDDHMTASLGFSGQTSECRRELDGSRKIA
jgi:hypothetical protein